jgi:hypothetical protein
MKKFVCLLFLASGAAYAGGSFGGGIGAVQNENNVFMLQRADYDNVVSTLSSKTLESFPVLMFSLSMVSWWTRHRLEFLCQLSKRVGRSWVPFKA